jgi:putative Holliday junction resolvase
MLNSQTLLSFDFGLKHIGVAVGQTATHNAQALTALAAKNGIPNWDEIAKLIHTWQPHALVVGIPLHMDDSEQPLTKKAKRFATQLEEHYKLPVHHVDERLTSVEARARLFEMGGYKALQKKHIDSVAAQVILEIWLAG